MKDFVGKIPAKMLRTTRGAFNIIDVVIMVVLTTALIPTIAVQIAGTTNLSSNEQTLLGLTTLFLILGLIVSVAKGSGLIGKR